jgi:excisionase family DNA binding protein
MRDVAARLEMDRSHVYKLAKRGELVTFRQGRALRVRREDLERFIQQRLNGGSAMARGR